MAITVKTTPAQNIGDYPSAHNDLFFVVESSNVAEPNFKYVFDVYIDAVKVFTAKVFPHPSNQFGVFDAGPVVRNYLSNLWFTGSNLFTNILAASGNFYIPYVIHYGEEYGTTVTTYPSLSQSATLKAYNYYNELAPAGEFHNLGNYVHNLLAPDHRRTVTLTDNYFLTYWNKDALAGAITVEAFTSAGVSQGTYVANTGTNELLLLNCGVPAINAGNGSTLINASTAYYTITFAAGGSIRFDVDCWPKYTHYGLTFLNKLGGYDTQFFRMKNSRELSVERKTFGKLNWEFTGDGEITYQNGNTLFGDGQIYAVKQKNKFRLKSDHLSDEEYDYLGELVASSQVYIELKNGNASKYYPVKITGDNYQFKRRANDKLTTLELEVEILQGYNSQFA